MLQSVERVQGHSHRNTYGLEVCRFKDLKDFRQFSWSEGSQEINTVLTEFEVNNLTTLILEESDRSHTWKV
jgi:hypothetical protein